MDVDIQRANCARSERCKERSEEALRIPRRTKPVLSNPLLLPTLLPSATVSDVINTSSLETRFARHGTLTSVVIALLILDVSMVSAVFSLTSSSSTLREARPRRWRALLSSASSPLIWRLLG